MSNLKFWEVSKETARRIRQKRIGENLARSIGAGHVKELKKDSVV
jgi:hypothetical protein